MKTKLLCTFVALLGIIPVWGYDCEVNGIYYDLDTYAKTATVTYRNTSYASYSSSVIIIPSTFEYNGTTYNVTSIGARAFMQCSTLSSIQIPDGVISIGNSAFSECSRLAIIDLPNSVTSIGYGAFYATEWYENQPDGVVYAGKVAYTYKGASYLSQPTRITLESGTRGIAEKAFYNLSGLKSVDINMSVVCIGEKAFSECSNLTTISIPPTVTSVGYDAFSKTAWYNRQSDGLIYVGLVAYKYKGTMPNGTAITLRSGTKEITKQAFYGCTGLISIDLPDGLKKIGESAFGGCSTLNSLEIPSSITSVDKYAFVSCSSLTYVHSKIENPFAFGYHAFGGISDNCVLMVPAGTRDAYIAAGWTEDVFKGGIVEEEPVTPDHKKGDANGDGTVNGTDIVVIANMVLGRKEKSAAGDANGDGNVNGTDIVVVANIVLGRTTSAPVRKAPAVTASGSATLSIEPFNISAGSEATMTIDLNNPDDELTLVQFDLTLPKGVSIKTVGDDLDIDMAGRTSWRKHSLDANWNDGYYTFLLKSDSNTPISGTEGGIITVTLVADATFTGGKIVIDNTVLTTPEEVEINPARYEYSLGGDEPTPVPDGICLFIEPFSITAGSEATMTVDLNNADDVITLVQFDLTLPKGLSVKTVGGDFDIDMAGRTTWRKHSLDANLNDGYYTFLLKSDSNTPIDGTSGGIITVTLVADASFVGGKIVIDNTVLTTPEEVEINPARYEYSLGGDEPTPVPEGTCLFIEPFNITAGSEATMTIDLNNADDVITLVQFDLTLPQGLSIKTMGGDFDIDMAGRTTWRKHSLDANLNDGYYTFLLKSDSNTPIDGTSGGIITITLVADASFDSGKIVIDNTVLTTPDEVEINPAYYEYEITVPTALPTLKIDRNQPQFIYNLQGQRLSVLQKGINIIDGKKVMVK